MRAGVGLVVLHQASTVPAADRTVDLQRWLGGARYGMFDRATEMAEVAPATPTHPVSRGLAPFTYLTSSTRRFAGRTAYNRFSRRDCTSNFATARTSSSASRSRARSRGSTNAPAAGGHSVTPAGTISLHSISRPNQDDLERDRLDRADQVPAAGISSHDAVVTRAADRQVIEQTWGRITWYASGPLGNSRTMTVGEAVIRPGQENPRHYHPNCDEILHVVRGRILHRWGHRRWK